MSVVNARLNKNVVRQAKERLKIVGFGRTLTANDTTEKVIPLRDILWVGAPFVAMVNYKVNKCANRMYSTILLLAFTKAQSGALKPRDMAQVSYYWHHIAHEQQKRNDAVHELREGIFAYQDVQWVVPKFEDDGSWSVDVNDIEAIVELLHKKRVWSNVCSIKTYVDSLVRGLVATSKEGQRVARCVTWMYK